MLLIITILIFTTSFIYIYLFINILYRDRILISNRLDILKASRSNREYDELSLPFYQRVIRPIAQRISEGISKITPGGIKTRISEKLIIAGNPLSIGINQWLLIKSIFGVAMPIGMTFMIMSVYGFDIKNMTIALVLSIIMFLFPDLIIKQITKNRQREILNTLPDVLDLLTVSVEAGLSFDGALSRLVAKVENQLSKEFGRVLNEIRMGRTRKEALKEMSLRCGVPDLTTFVGAIIQADELGVGISNVLRIQSKQMRQKRRQRAQEKAMKAPVKMLFPLVFFIFPTIFSVLLGPAMIRIINQFMK